MNTTAPSPPIRPWTAGLCAARANIKPGLVVQAAMLCAVLAYYFYEPSRGGFDLLARWKEQYGFTFSFTIGALAGGVFPELLVIGFFQRGRIQRKNWGNLLFGICFWGYTGVIVDVIYRVQAWTFGTGVDFWTIAPKVIADQFFYTPLFQAPVMLAVFEWRKRGYRFGGLGCVFTWRFYKERTVPVLISRRIASYASGMNSAETTGTARSAVTIQDEPPGTKPPSSPQA